MADREATKRASPTSRSQLLGDMERARSELDATIARIPRDAFERPGAWGEWTLKDLVAHIAAYERWTSEQMETAQPTEELQKSVTEEATGGVDSLNRMIYEQHRNDALAEVLAESRAAYEALRAAIERKSDEELARPAWYSGSGTLLEFLPEQSYAHYRDHLADLAAAAGR